MHPEYFEGILQLREPDKKVIDFVRKHAVSQITKEKGVANGIDFYFFSQRFLRAFGKKLKKSFNGELRESRKLHTVSRKTGKNLYRVNVLFRLLRFKKGDVVSYRGDKIKIKTMGKLISGINIDTGERVSFRAADV